MQRNEHDSLKTSIRKIISKQETYRDAHVKQVVTCSQQPEKARCVSVIHVVGGLACTSRNIQHTLTHILRLYESTYVHRG